LGGNGRSMYFLVLKELIMGKKESKGRREEIDWV
jgi:hypothetical protein